nr:tape measure protein [Pelosinus baikalensis]
MAPISAYAIQLSSNMQQAKISMDTMLGSAQKADAMIADLWKFAAETPFEFTELQMATKRMLAFGFAAEDIIPDLTAIGDAAAGLGVGSEGVNRITLALGQMKAKSKVSGDEMLQMTEAGIPAWDILSKSIGKSTAEVMKLAEKGVIPADQAIQALLVGMEERFPGMMDKQSKSLQGLFSTLKDNVSTVLIEVFKPAVAWLTDVGLPKLVEMTGNFSDTIKSGGSITEAISSMFSGGFDGVLDQMGTVGEYLKNIGDMIAWVKDNANMLIPVLAGLAGAFVGLQIIQTVLGPLEAFVVTGIVVIGVVSAICIALGNMAAAAAIAPYFYALIGVLGELAKWSLIIGGVTIAISLLAAAAYLIYDNWEPIKAWMINFWNSLVNIVADNIALIVAIFPGLGLAAYVIYEYWDDAVNAANKVITWLAEQVAFVTDKITNNFQWYSKMWDDFVAWAKQGVSDFKVYLSDLVDSFIPAWASSMLGGIQSLGQKLAAKTAEIGKAMRENLTITPINTSGGFGSVPYGPENTDKMFAGINENGGAGSDTYGPAMKSAGIKAADWSKVDFTGGGTDKEAAKAAKAAAKEARQVIKEQSDYEIDIQKNKATLLLDLIKTEQEDLDRERKGGLKAIRQYWSSREDEDSAGLAVIKDYWDKKNALDIKGINAELETLNAQKAALDTEIAATADQSDSIKLKKEMLDLTTKITLKERELGDIVKKNTDSANAESIGYIEKRASLLESIKQSMKDLNATNVINGLNGSNKDLAEFEQEKASRIKSVQDIVDNWDKAAAEIKDSYGIALKDTIDKDKWRAEQFEMINKQSIDEVNKYYATGKALQADLDEAYNNGNLAEYRNLLNSKLSLQQQELKGQQAMADTYKTIWNEANKSTTEIMADAISSFNSGMQSVFKDMISGVDGAKSAWVGFRDTVIDIIADIYAKQMSANLTSSLMSWLPGISTPSFELPGVSVSAATGGAIYGPGTGTSDSIMAMLSNGEYVIKASSVKQFGTGFFDTLNNGRMPAFATGGLVTGAPLSSVGNSYSSASTGQSNGGNETPNIRVNINNYGNANVQAEKPQYDAQSKSYILTVMVDGLKNNSSVRSAAKGAMK